MIPFSKSWVTHRVLFSTTLFLLFTDSDSRLGELPFQKAPNKRFILEMKTKFGILGVKKRSCIAAEWRGKNKPQLQLWYGSRQVAVDAGEVSDEKKSQARICASAPFPGLATRNSQRSTKPAQFRSTFEGDKNGDLQSEIYLFLCMGKSEGKVP